MRVRLRKWYLDGSSPDGRTAIVYAGEARLAGLTLHFFEAFVRDATRVHAHVATTSVRPIACVTESAGSVELAARAHGISGAWTGAASALSATLYSDARTRIEWRRPQPAAKVVLLLCGSSKFDGFGYAEYLTFEGAATAALPFTRILWGRFIGGGHHATWIDWAGGTPRHWVFVDDAPVDGARVSVESVDWTGGSLKILPGSVIREGTVVGHVLRRWARMLPANQALASETKWASGGRLHFGSDLDTGSVVHERVIWP